MPSHVLETAEALTSRPPSARDEEMPSPALNSIETPISLMPPTHGEEQILDPDENRASTDVEDSDDESEDEDPRWTTVRRGRARSLDSVRNSLKNKKIIYLNPNALSTEQKKVDNTAPNLINNDTEDPGTSRDKGKTIDPREWGNAGIEPEELDIGIQEAIIKEYERGQKNAKKGPKRPKIRKEKIPDKSKDEGNFNIPTVPRERSIASVAMRVGSRPATHILPDSSLGVALGT